jgi:Cu/Zn superoxide dismutase
MPPTYAGPGALTGAAEAGTLVAGERFSPNNTTPSASPLDSAHHLGDRPALRAVAAGAQP